MRNAKGVIKKSTQQYITDGFNLSSISHADKVTKAEVIFCTSVAVHNLPYAYGNTASSIFPIMFEDSNIAKDFKCKSTKVSYLISDGLGPFFKEKLVNEVYKTQCYYTVQIDETPVAEKRVEQLDILLRYFSDNNGKVVIRHWETCHIGSATADKIVTCVQESLEGLPSDKLLSVFSDGPNVMKCFKKKMMDLYPGLLDVGECVLHKVHNSFAYGLNVFGADVESLIVDIYYFFKRSALQSEKVRELQVKLGLPEHVFLRHVSSRWLTLETSIARIIEQFTVLKEFFKNKTQSRCESNRLANIKQAFADKSLFPKLLFLQNVSKIFVRFLKMYQTESPMIHTLYDEMVSFVKTIMGRFLNEEFFRNKQVTDIEIADIEKGDNWSRVDIGVDTEKSFESLSYKDKQSIRMGARSFYISVTKYLLKSLPLQNQILRNLRCLHPSYRLKEESLQFMKFLAVQLPNVIPIQEVSSVTDEFIRLQAEENSNIYPEVQFDTPELEDDELSEEDENGIPELPKANTERIDEYWGRILKIKDATNNLKYKNLGKVVKALLCLPHGNADVERGFSTNKHMLENRSSLSLHSINALRKVKCHIKTNCENKVENLQITRDLLKSARLSRQRKNDRLQELKKGLKRANDENIDEINDPQKLLDEEKELCNRLKAAQTMIENAQQTISNGIKTKNMTTIESGQILLQEATSRMNNILEAQHKNKIELEKSKLTHKKKIKKV